jgi:hypothetical protein
MHWFRSLNRSIHALVVAFLLAQFAGVVPSPLASAQNFADAVTHHAHHQHAQGYSEEGGGSRHRDRTGNHGDTCCALHAFFAGVVPCIVAIEIRAVAGQRITAVFAEDRVEALQNRLDRPPKPVVI